MTRVWGVSGMPPGERPHYYPDMQSEKLIGAIEADGVRYAWSRAAHCPCEGVNDLTDQPDPNCALCRGLGVIYFGPADYVPAADAGELTDVQRALIAVDGAVVIRGISGRFARAMTHVEAFYDVLGRWRWGEALIVVRPENRLGYYDRLVNLDAIIVHSELITLEAGATTIPTRYRVVGVNMVRTLGEVFVADTDFEVAAGVITLDESRIPEDTTQVAVHYLTHPVWRVADMPHSTRTITRRRPVPREGQETPTGIPVDLPVAAVIKLEHIPLKEADE